MKLFRGLAKTDYQDVLRAIGLFIDEHGYTDVRTIEIEDGVVLQGRVRGNAASALLTTKHFSLPMMI
jgi:hypothetical protein